MREIKFRAWDKIGGTNIMKSWEQLMAQYQYMQIFNNEEYFELMQYTGLKDKNGKEIYEGDILAIEHEQRDGHLISIFKVEGSNSLWGYQYYFKLISGYPCTTHILNYDYSNCGVIGNIYENPELLDNDND